MQLRREARQVRFLKAVLLVTMTAQKGHQTLRKGLLLTWHPSLATEVCACPQGEFWAGWEPTTDFGR